MAFYPEVVWQTTNDPADPAEIARVEAALFLRFPHDYLKVVIPYHGGHPHRESPYIIDLPTQGDTAFQALFSFDRNSRDYIVRVWGGFFAHLPLHIIPFADDGGGNLFAFDFRESRDAPTVVFVDHEVLNEQGFLNVVSLSTTFSEFVAGMRHDPYFLEENEQVQ
jgi:hypothetical protein